MWSWPCIPDICVNSLNVCLFERSETTTSVVMKGNAVFESKLFGYKDIHNYNYIMHSYSYDYRYEQLNIDYTR